MVGACAHPVREVLDLGAGTGKLTEGLLAEGFAVIAVEPDEAMRVELARRVPVVRSLDGVAERIPLPDRAVDAVLCGQAFHWFDMERALPEIARVLRPGGVLGALWNHDDDSVEWVAELGELTRTSVSHVWRTGHELPAHPAFGPFERAEFPHRQRRTADSLTATVGTHSNALVIPGIERADMLARVRRYLASRPETAHGEFDLPMITTVVRATRTANSPA